MKENPIDKDKTTDTPGLLPYAHTVGSAVIRPDDIGLVKHRSLTAMEEQTNIQLKQIQEQIELLAKQAQQIKNRAEISYRIYSAEMGFEPIVGHTYYLYQKEDGQHLLSMIAPNEWGRSKRTTVFLSKVKLMGDRTWELLTNGI